MRISITNYELRITNYQRLICLLVFLCALGVNFSFGQTNENLAEQIRSGNSEQKRSALFEIRNRRSADASRIAVPALTDPDEMVRATAAASVIYLPKDEAFSALSPNLQDVSEIVRREAAYALGKIQNPAAIEPLIAAFQKDKSTAVKNASVAALGEIGDVSAVGFLLQILGQKPKAENEFLRRCAAHSIGQIAQIIQIKQAYTVTPESFLPEKFKLFTLEKYQNLSAIFPPFAKSVEVLAPILQSPTEADDTKRETAFALGVVGDVSALPLLQTNVNSKDYYLAEICRESIKKLSSIKPSE